MRVVVVSSEPTLTLTLGSQVPGFDAQAASTVDSVLDLTRDDGVVLLDVGSAEAAATWLDALRQGGLERGVVVIGEDVTDDHLNSVVRLSRPFSLGDLAQAFGRLTSEATDAVGISDGSGLDPEARRGSVPIEVDIVVDIVYGEVDEQVDDERSAIRVTDTADAGGRSAIRVAKGLVAAQVLESLLADMVVLTDAEACGRAVLEEIAEQMTVGSSAIALRGERNDLEVVATAGVPTGLRNERLALDHPFLRAVEQRDGALLLAPTDLVRGLVAGMPASNWPVLLAVIVPGEHLVDGLVLVGRSEPADRADLVRLEHVVNTATDVLRLAAAIRRMSLPGREYGDHFHSWM